MSGIRENDGVTKNKESKENERAVRTVPSPSVGAFTSFEATAGLSLAREARAESAAC